MAAFGTSPLEDMPKSWPNCSVAILRLAKKWQCSQLLVEILLDILRKAQFVQRRGVGDFCVAGIPADME